MNEFMFNYLLILSVSGFLLLLFFALLTFFNTEAFKLKKDTNIKSTISLVIAACLYLGIFIFLLVYRKRNNNIEIDNQHEIVPNNSNEHTNSNLSN